MSKLKKKIFKTVGKIVNYVTAATSQGTSDGSLGKDFVPDKDMIALCRETGAEGIVMLKNKDNVLPITEDRVVSVFG